MKKKGKRVRRQIFVFTIEEKKAAACVLAAFLLGLATMHYRKTHPRPPPPLTPRQQYQQQRSEKAAKAYARSARGQSEVAGNAPAARGAASTATPEPKAEEDDE